MFTNAEKKKIKKNKQQQQKKKPELCHEEMWTFS